ncbi:MAG: hypothetical protein EOS45_21720 [Mesorhizobium sp.]|nr:MAG: hypothetical protein EOS45_21720 [Mesorhizobium sp.]
MSGFAEDMPFFDEPNARPAAPSGIAARAMAARSGQNSAPDYLKGLNPEQRLAVETTEGPVLVLAGAGTGKTRVLTTRIAHILATGKAFSSQILAVTFTNKAAREMKQRIGHLIGEGNVEGMPWLGTFHSIGVKLLRRHAELAGLKSDFTILDTDDVVRLIKQLIQAEGLDDKRWPAKQFAQMIDGWKNKGLGPADIPEGDARSFANGKGRELYKAYQERLQTLNACDFGDLLCHPIRIFRAYPDVLKDYHRRFKYILVDEYQDTNTAQYMWLRLLAQRDNVAVKISDLVAYDHDWTLDSLRPVVLHCIDCFGTKRAMFGSDFPVAGLHASFDEVYDSFKAISAGLSADEQAALFFDTARRIYRLDELSSAGLLPA